MKTLIEVKTGKAVDTGDVIELDGSAHILTDYDVPGLVGRGILTFSTVDTFPTDNTETVREDCEESVSSVDTGTIPMFNPQDLTLKKTLLNWGIKMGLKTEDEVLQCASLIKAATPIGFIGVVLRELADEFNVYDTYQSHEWAFDCANCQIVKVDPQQMLYPENVVMFDSYEVLNQATRICKELVDEICPDGE